MQTPVRDFVALSGFFIEDTMVVTLPL